MPVLGSASAASSTFNPAAGTYIPVGWGAQWKAKRNASTSTLCELVFFGDSTMYGAADPSRPPSTFSPVQEVRTQLIAAGYGDGGRGVVTTQDDANLSLPDAFAPQQSITGFTSGDAGGMVITSDWKSTTAGDTVTIQGKGTAVRVTYVRRADSSSFTVAIDGGAPVTVTPTRAASGLTYRAASYIVSGLTEGTHTVVITNNGDAGFTVFQGVVEFVRATGIVVQKFAASGISTPAYFQTTNSTLLNYQAAHALGLDTSGTSVNGFGWGLPKATGAAARNVGAAVFTLGTNDVQGAAADGTGTPEKTISEGIAIFARMCAAAGADPIVWIPAYDAATSGHQYAGRVRAASHAAGIQHGCAVYDAQVPLGPVTGWNALGYGSGNTAAPHLSKVAYQKQAQTLVTNLLLAP